jgi:diaminohydroxyphosphoribosylaminopyrimidine deaminase/5-amino-6-(5-phosphoribosylamino)uracil reductase
MNDEYFLRLAIEEARKSRDSDGYHIGVVVVKDGKIISRAYSDEKNRNSHAEELALQRASINPFGGTVYTTMEPCSFRPSGKPSCTDLIIAYGIKRVIFGAKDPEINILNRGEERLRYIGVEVIHLKELEKVCREVTALF